MNSINRNNDKPTVLSKPKSLKRFLLLLLALFVVIYVAIGAMAFLRNQTEAPTVPSTPSSQEQSNA